MTHALCNLRNLECVELTQKPGNTSCVFDDLDIDPEFSVKFLRGFEALIHRNTNLLRINIFFPILMSDLAKFAMISLPKIFNIEKNEHQADLINFFGLDCEALRKDAIGQDFLQPMYSCYAYE